MAELHIIGQVASAKDFEQVRILCKWSFHAGIFIKVFLRRFILFLKQNSILQHFVLYRNRMEDFEWKF